MDRYSRVCSHLSMSYWSSSFNHFMRVLVTLIYFGHTSEYSVSDLYEPQFQRDLHGCMFELGLMFKQEVIAVSTLFRVSPALGINGKLLIFLGTCRDSIIILTNILVASLFFILLELLKSFCKWHFCANQALSWMKNQSKLFSCQVKFNNVLCFFHPP